MKEILRFALVKTLPVFFGYLFLGIAFGILLQKAGFGWIWAFFISLLVYAGSMQFMLVSFLSGGVGIVTVILMTLLINSRHLFYGLTFIDTFRRMGRSCLYMIFSLTDETYSLLCSVKVPKALEEKKVLLSIAALDHLYWIFGSVVGAVMGSMMQFDATGIDFAMTALFVVIFLEQWREFKTHVPALTGLFCGILCLLIFGPNGFILPALVLCTTILMVSRRHLDGKVGVRV